MAEPLVVEIVHEPVRQGYVEIIDTSTGGRVVTSIELLSPSNKVAGEGRTLYLRKQAELKEGEVSSVEIDLLRSGSRTFAIPPAFLPEPLRKGYGACVRRSWCPGRYELYAFALRERLPAVRIPLRPTDADVPLDLQALIDLACENGGYDTLNYHSQVDPPLDDDDRHWADALLREQGCR